ncbi:isopentenyl-diphosphate Delta-isomerase [Halocola ammonii]
MSTMNEINVTTDFDNVILVDENDKELGTMPKMEAHEKGLLHRAFSVFVFNSSGELLLHKRASDKYHCGGMWTNTCCSHPRQGEEVKAAAHRRLQEEMGFNCTLVPAFEFTYKSELDNHLLEHEYDHVFLGEFDSAPSPNQGEVEDWQFMRIDEIRNLLETSPQIFTPWFKIVFERVLNYRSESPNLNL